MKTRLKSLVVRSIASLLLVCLGACADAPAQNSDKLEVRDPIEKYFPDTFESVWRAVQLAMADYPIRVNSQDSGIIETDFIRAGQAWKNPGRFKEPPGGLRYKINVKVLMIKNKSGDFKNRVIILKNAEMQDDFFSDFKRYPSDGLEEETIMYRVDRELKIERALKKANNPDALEL